jgi:hypothetical protein
MVEQTLPLVLQYHDAWNRFVEFQGQRVDEAASESRSHYARAHSVVLSLILLSAGLCAGAFLRFPGVPADRRLVRVGN